MMESKENNYFIVQTEALPEVFIKTIEVKELLNKGEAKTIFEAVEKVGISRSAYYKYKDYVFPFYEMSKGRMITVGMALEHSPGILSEVLYEVAKVNASILTINQNIPVHGVANVTATLETKNITTDIERLLKNIKSLQGVKDVHVLSKE